LLLFGHVFDEPDAGVRLTIEDSLHQNHPLFKAGVVVKVQSQVMTQGGRKLTCLNYGNIVFRAHVKVFIDVQIVVPSQFNSLEFRVERQELLVGKLFAKR